MDRDEHILTPGIAIGGSLAIALADHIIAQLNGKPVKLSPLVKPGVHLELAWADPEPLTLLPEDIPLDILYEDERVVVLNKAQGMVVHPGAGNHSGTLANTLRYRRLNREAPLPPAPPALSPALALSPRPALSPAPAAPASSTAWTRTPPG